LLAFQYDKFESICHDLVNHLVNDCIVMGAKPLSIQDCIVCGKVEKPVVLRMVNAFAEAAKNNECTLTGGETSWQPGTIAEGVYVLTASIVGVVEREQLVQGAADLERARALEALALEEDAEAGQLVQRVGADRGRAVDPAGEPPRGGLHVVEGERCGRRHGHTEYSAPCPPSRLRYTRAMRTALVLALAAALAGCSLITLDLTPRLQPLEEEVVEGSGAAKVLLLDVSGFLADEGLRPSLTIGTPPPLEVGLRNFSSAKLIVCPTSRRVSFMSMMTFAMTAIAEVSIGTPMSNTLIMRSVWADWSPFNATSKPVKFNRCPDSANASASSGGAMRRCSCACASG